MGINQLELASAPLYTVYNLQDEVEKALDRSVVFHPLRPGLIARLPLDDKMDLLEYLLDDAGYKMASKPPYKPGRTDGQWYFRTKAKESAKPAPGYFMYSAYVFLSDQASGAKVHDLILDVIRWHKK
jgi:hypothetical protein